MRQFNQSQQLESFLCGLVADVRKDQVHFVVVIEDAFKGEGHRFIVIVVVIRT